MCDSTFNIKQVFKISNFFRGFSVVAPELAVPGKTTAVFVTLHGPKGLQPLNVSLQLTRESEDEETSATVIETTQEITGMCYSRCVSTTFLYEFTIKHG